MVQCAVSYGGADMAARLGDVLYWAFSLVALLVVLDVAYWFFIGGSTWRHEDLVYFGVLVVVLWLIGRAARKSR
jgi:hypothetical protein